ncbi:MAG: hypothetical protein J6M18_04770 [Actinomycetaceae bacterium]|nr:hypothetical protein [Actinomycetaceae bacterium]
MKQRKNVYVPFVVFIAAFAVIVSLFLSPLKVHADGSIVSIGDITDLTGEGTSVSSYPYNGSEVVFRDTSGKYLALTDAGDVTWIEKDDSWKWSDLKDHGAVFVLQAHSYSQETSSNFLSFTDGWKKGAPIAHYRVVSAHNGLILAMKATGVGTTTKTLLGVTEEFINATDVLYRVDHNQQGTFNNGGSMGIYTTAFSSNGERVWFAMNTDYADGSYVSSPGQHAVAWLETAQNLKIEGISHLEVLTESEKNITITYKDWDGDVIQTHTIKETDERPNPPAPPTRSADDDNTYTFKEWAESVDSDGNVTYVATYESTSISKHTVTYKDWNGSTLLGPVTVKDGDSDPATPAAPTRADSDTHSYTFKEWVKTVDGSGNVEYRASYTETPLKGTVTIELKDDSSGDPLNGQVEVTCSDGTTGTYAVVDGRVSFEANAGATCSIKASADGHEEKTIDVTVNKGNNSNDITLKAVYTVDVAIIDSETRAPISAGRVDIYDASGTKVASNVAQGDALNLPGGTYTAKQAGDINGYEKAADKQFTVNADNTQVRLEATPKTVSSTVRVLDENGDPLPEATVNVVCADGNTYPGVVDNGNGNFTVVLPRDAEECAVRVDAPDGYKDSDDTPIIPGENKEITLDKVYAVDVKIVDADDAGKNPLSGTVVIKDETGATVAEVSSGASVDLPEGKYTATQKDPIDGYNDAPVVSFEVTDDGTDPVILEATLKTKTSTITVVDEDGNPIDDAVVGVLCEHKDGIQAQKVDGKPGEYTITVVEDAKCVINVKTPNGYDDPEDTDLTPGDDYTITITKTKYDVNVDIVDGQDDSRLVGDVDIKDADGNVVATVASGESVSLPAGTYTATQKSDIDGHANAPAVTFEVKDSDTSVVLKAQPLKESTVRVVDDNGNAIGGATLTVTCGDGTQAVITEVAKGEFTIVLPADAQECSVHVETPDGYSDPADVDLNPGADVDVVARTAVLEQEDVNAEADAYSQADATGAGVGADAKGAVAPSTSVSNVDVNPLGFSNSAISALSTTGTAAGLFIVLASIFIMIGGAGLYIRRFHEV